MAASLVLRKLKRDMSSAGQKPGDRGQRPLLEALINQTTFAGESKGKWQVTMEPSSLRLHNLLAETTSPPGE